jgi:hypothetical protein
MLNLRFLFYFILFYFILFYFILFYFILFYFILFYFILFTSQEGLCQANDGTIIGMYKFLLVTNFGGH